MVHVIPVNDIKPHIDNIYCNCKPKLIEKNTVAVHNSYDGREITELAIDNISDN